MFQIGDRVVYGIHGVCSVIGLEDRRVDRKLVQYYVLEPLDHPGSRYFIPSHNQLAMAKVHRVISQQELSELLCSDEVKQDVWVADENLRKQRYREILSSGDRAALLCMVRTLHRHRLEQAAVGRKFHICDENYLRDAQKLLSSEFSLVLGIEPGQVGDYVREKMGLEG